MAARSSAYLLESALSGTGGARQRPMTPFFIIGNPRSGTTLLRIMMNAHSAITVPPECGFALWLADKYSGLKICDEKLYCAFAEDVLLTRKFETWGVGKQELLDALKARSPCDYVGLATAVYEAYGFRQGKRPQVVGDKNNYYVEYIGKLMSIFPRAKLVCLIRDGRDVACSYLALARRRIDSRYRPRLPTDIASIAREWSDNAARISALDSKGSVFIRYEDLVHNPQEQLTVACALNGLEFSPTMLSYWNANDEPGEFLQWKEKTCEGLDQRNCGKYREQLTQQEIEQFEGIAGDMLRRFGYTF